MTSISHRAALLGLAILLLAGCNANPSLPQTQTGDPTQPMDFNLLTDIPIPAGATMDNDRSLILGDRDRWTGRVVMKLWKSAAESTNFYQQQMPSFGWESIMAATSGVSMMSYIRGDRAATVLVERSMVGSIVSVTVGPRAIGQGPGNAGPNSSTSAAKAAEPTVPAPPGYYDAPLKPRSEPLATTPRR